MAGIKLNKVMLGLLLASLLIFVSLSPGASVVAGTSTVSIVVPANISIGQTFTANVAVTPGSALSGMQFDLEYDSALLDFVKVEEGTLLSQSGASTFFQSGAADTDIIRTVSGVIITPGKNAFAEGIFARVNFVAKTQTGTCPLTLSNVVLGDINGQPLQATISNSAIAINAPPVTTTAPPTTTTVPTTTTTVTTTTTAAPTITTTVAPTTTTTTAPLTTTSSPPTTTTMSSLITLTSPDGGEEWITGTNQVISWSSVNLSGNVNIQVSRDNGRSWMTIAYNTANDGAQSWKVSTPATTEAFIKVVSTSNAGIFDASNASFTITDPAAPATSTPATTITAPPTTTNPATPSIVLTSPNGGESWTKSTSHNITWSSTGLTGYVRIELLKGASVVKTLSSATLASKGTYTWSISSSTVAASDYSIRLTSLQDASVTDTGDGYFTIAGSTVTTTKATTTSVAKTTITVTSPNGGESWAAGTTRTFTWKSSNLKDNVDIQLSTDGGSSWTTIISNTENDGTAAWTVASINTSKARAKIVSTSNKSIYDTSNKNFTISTSVSTRLHIKSLSVRLWPLSIGGTELLRATAVVTVVDGQGKVVEGVTVHGVWTGALTESDTGVTSSIGTATLTSTLAQKNSGATFSFTVTNIVLGGFTYDATADLVTSGQATYS